MVEMKTWLQIIVGSRAKKNQKKKLNRTDVN